MEPTDLSPPQRRVLQAVAEREDDDSEPTAHAIARQLQVDVGDVHRQLSALIEKDLVVELGADDHLGPRYAVKDRPAPG